MRVVLSPKAEGDLEVIGDYIARDNPRSALSFIREMRAFMLRLGDNPRAHPEQLHLRPNLRRAVFGAYLIFYTATDAVRIERVLHSGRDLSSGLPDR